MQRFDGVAISCARSSTVPYVDQMEEPTPTRVNYKLGICAMAPESVRLTMENADFRRVVKKEVKHIFHGRQILFLLSLSISFLHLFRVDFS